MAKSLYRSQALVSASSFSDLHVGDGLGLNLRNALDGLELLKECALGFMAALFPGTERIQRHGNHKLEVEASSTNEAVDLDAVADSLDFGKVLINDLGDLLQRFGRGLVTGVLASPLTAHTVELHGA